MNSPTNTKTPFSGRFLLLASFVYLLITDALFFIGWFNPVVASVLTVMMTFCIAAWYIREDRGREIQTWNKSLITKFITCIIIILLFLVIGGMIGGFPTHGDSWAFRQALFLNLKDAPWPLVLPDGREMSYYLAGMIPSAMLARMLPENLQQSAVLVCTFIPILLYLCLSFNKIRKISIIFLLLALGFQDPLCAVFRPGATIGSGSGFMAGIIQTVQNWGGPDLSILVTYYGNKTLGAPIHNCIGAYNSVPATILVAIMLTFLKEKPGIIALLIAMLTPISPLGALACMPVALYYFFTSSIQTLYGLKNLLPLICGIAIAVVTGLYFMRAESELNVIDFAWNVRGTDFWFYYLRYIAGLAILTVPLYKSRKKDYLYWIIVCAALVLPTIYVGSIPNPPVIQGFNELLLKGVVVYTAILAIMWYQDFSGSKSWIWRIMVLWAFLASCVYMATQIRRFEYGKPVDDMWNGHLCHKRDFLHQSVPTVKEPKVPHLLLRNSGESELQFPGNLLPKAKGATYTATPHPQAFP